MNNSNDKIAKLANFSGAYCNNNYLSDKTIQKD